MLIGYARIYKDRASGRHDRRLGRNLRHLMTTVEDLHDRGVGLRVLAGAGAEIDTTTAGGSLAFGIFAARDA